MSGATLRKKELPLATAPVHKLVLSFMLTALAGLLLNTVYSLTDALFGLLPENSSVLWAFPAAYAFSAVASAAVFAVRGRSLFLCALPYERMNGSPVNQ